MSVVEYCRLVEYERDLYKFIREYEIKRFDEDLFNVHKLDELYRIYFKIKGECERWINM